MAKPGLWTNKKFLNLVAMLQIPVPHAVGYLECLWSAASQAGHAMIGNPRQVEIAARWDGEEGKLFDALRDCGWPKSGFVEACPDIEGAWQIHDFGDHCATYVKERLKKRDQRARAKDSPDIVPGQSRDNLGTVPGHEEDSPGTVREKARPSSPLLSSPSSFSCGSRREKKSGLDQALEAMEATNGRA